MRRERGLGARDVGEVARCVGSRFSRLVRSVGLRRGGNVGVVGTSVIVVGPVRFAVETAYASWLLVAIGTHVFVILVLAYFLALCLLSVLLSSPTWFLTDRDEVFVKVCGGYDATTSEPSGPCSMTKSFAVWSFAS